ncbi:hypothetical protein D3C81_1149040 [compost metagenome]
MKDHATDESERTLLHDRWVHCAGYLRKDGLIDIEGCIEDVKTVDCDTLYKTVQAGEPFHRMRLVLTVDMDFLIHEVKASTDAGPTPICGNIADAYSALKGLTIGPGFKKKAAHLVGGVHGCTHITELLGPMATTLYQTTFDMLHEAESRRVASDPDYQRPRPWVIGTCHAYHPDSDVTRLILRDAGLEGETNGNH